MKKLLTIATIGVLGATTALSAIDWGTTIENLATGSSVTVSSNSGAAASIADGNDGSSWQAEGGANKYENDWALIDLGESKSFNTVEIKWEASHPSSYSIYASADAIPYAATEFNKGTDESPNNVTYNVIDAAWLAANTPVATSDVDGESGVTDTVEFSDVTARYILIYCTAYNGWAKNYGSRIFEARVGSVQHSSAATSLKVTAEAVTEGETATVTVEALNNIGETVDLSQVDNLQLTCTAGTVAGSAGSYTVTGLTHGSYTLTATGSVAGTEISGTATLTVNYNWADKVNIATGKDATARVKAETDVPNPAANAVDGDEETYYQYNGDWGGGDSYVIVDLGKEYMVEAIGALYKSNSGKGRVRFAYGAAGATMPEADVVWKGTTDGWTAASAQSRSDNSTPTHAYDTPVKARYIAVIDDDNPSGKPCVYEIYATGEEYVQPAAASIEITTDKGGLFAGETATVTAAVKDQYGDDFSGDVTVTVTGADYADGTITAGTAKTITITATCGEISATKTLTVASTDDYCMAGATVTSNNESIDGANAIDGGSTPDNSGNLYVVQDGGEKTQQNWILANLHKPYDLDMIVAGWEGAAPAAYDVYVGADTESLVKAYSVSGRTEVKTYWDRFSGETMSGVQYIKIVTLGNVSGYGCKLRDLKAYGVSNATSTVTSVALTVSDDLIATGEKVTFSAKVYDQYEGEMDGQTVTYSVNGVALTGNEYTATDKGTFTVEAACGSVKATATLNVVASENDKVGATDVTATLNGDDANNPLQQEVSFGEGVEHTLVITFPKAYNFDLLKLRWETAAPSAYTVTATYSDDTTATVFEMTSRDGVPANPVDRIVAAKTRASQEGNLEKVKSLTIATTARNHGWNLRLLGVDAYGVDSESVTTCISTVDAAEGETVIYDLQGRRVNRAGKGLYIINGKKVLVK